MFLQITFNKAFTYNSEAEISGFYGCAEPFERCDVIDNSWRRLSQRRSHSSGGDGQNSDSSPTAPSTGSPTSGKTAQSKPTAEPQSTQMTGFSCQRRLGRRKLTKWQKIAAKSRLRSRNLCIVDKSFWGELSPRRRASYVELRTNSNVERGAVNIFVQTSFCSEVTRPE